MLTDTARPAVTPMDSILFLTSAGESPPGNDNHVRLPEAFRAAGWRAATANHESLQMAGGALSCAGPVEAFDRIWCLGFGERRSFLDRMQLLSRLPQEQLVTGVDALLRLHGKMHWQELMPPSYLSCDPDYLLAQTGRGHDWVLKPPAGAYGRDLYRLRADDSAARKAELLRSLTAGNRYWLLQRYLPQIEDGEKRVLYAGGLLLDCYLRRPLPQTDSSARSDHMTAVPGANMATGATAETCALAPAERRLADRVANELLARGVGFAAIDLVHPYLMEVNIANPGGLGTLARLHGADPTAGVVRALVDFWAGGR
jgi:hypothetical protein